MNAYIIELNDSEIRVAKGTEIILRSPGIAVVNNDDLQVGESALKMAYLNPRETYNRYWNKLNQDTLQTPTKRYRHHADLAYAHLLSIYEQTGNPEEFLFIVPGNYSAEQLSMLLGIVEACPFTAVGLIDSAVANTAAVADTGEYQHIDIHLHQTIITKLDVHDDVSRTGVETIDETGLNKIYTIVAAMIADLFIQQSRFDPQHHAETEQALYDQLPACLKTLQNSKEVLFEIRYQNTTHQAKLTKETLLQKLQPVYEKIAEYISPSLPCLIGDRMASLPGLTDSLSAVDVIKPATVFESCQKHAATIRSSGPELSFITSLPASKVPTVSKPQPQPEEKSRARKVSHVLNRHAAHPIGGQLIYLSTNGDISNRKPMDVLCSVSLKNGAAILTVESNKPVLINDKAINKSTELHPGDRLNSETSDMEFNFIHVLNGHGTQ